MARLKKIFVILFLLFFLPQQVLADGIIFPPPEQNITEAQQKAVIVYQNGVEDLIISVEFYGDAKEFAWLIPTPAKPEIKKGNDELFTELGNLTKPKKNLLDKIKGERPEIITLMKGQEMTIGQKAVEVIESQRVGILDTVVLKATKAQELEKWLTDNGYKIPTQVFPEGPQPLEKQIFPRPSAPPSATINRTLQIFQDYLDEGWYFVAAKINNTFLTNLSPSVREAVEDKGRQMSFSVPARIGQAHITPLHLTFSSEKIIYPLKISSLSFASPSILLYLISDQKLETANFEKTFQTEYAAPLKASSLSEWLPNLSDGYLTKVYAPYLNSPLMTEDLRFKNSEDQKTVKAGEMKLKDWLKVPAYLAIYIPYRIINWTTSGSFDQGLNILPGLSLISLGGAFGLIWAIIFYLFLSRARKRFWRVILYALQFPGVWLLSNTLSLIIVMPALFLMRLLEVEPPVVMVGLLIRNNLGAVLFASLFYFVQNKIHLIFKK